MTHSTHEATLDTPEGALDPLSPQRFPDLAARGVTLAYDGQPVVADLDFTVPPGELTAIVGPNGCGKSTLLRSLARLLRPRHGSVVLDGQDLHAMRTTQVARKVALLPQGQVIPAGVTVTDLVSRGRFAHQGLLRRWSREDEEAVQRALVDTVLTELADREVASLSGGQRQRAWLAVVLAQDTPVLLLDEPTTYLDIAHQMEVLELCRELHERGRTIVAVLHDLNQAARFASHVVAMRDGAILVSGAPAEVLTSETVEKVFGWPCHVVQDPVHGTPIVIPLDGRGRR